MGPVTDKTNKLRNIYIVRRVAWKISIQIWKIICFKVDIISFIIIFELAMSFVFDKSKLKRVFQSQDNLLCLTEILRNLPFVRKKDFHYTKTIRYLEVGLNISLIVVRYRQHEVSFIT